MILRRRHIVKTLTWRLIGSLDTFLLSWFISGSIISGIHISGLEIISKMFLYYIHERVWYKSSVVNSHKRHLLKTFSWRAIGTLDTMLISLIITGNPLVGIKIISLEIISKFLLYYGHEKIWYRINYGLESRKIY